MPPKWKKSSPEIIERFKAALPHHPDVEPRSMFGYPASFVRGNFFAGLHEEKVVIRLPDGLNERVKEMAKADGFDPMQNGRGMSGWFVVPAPVTSSEKKLGDLLVRALKEVLTLPPKSKAAKKTKKPAAKKKAKATATSR